MEDMEAFMHLRYSVRVAIVVMWVVGVFGIIILFGGVKF